jgi:triosephosphate isomerase
MNFDNFSSIFIANWKLNGDIQFIKEYYQKLIPSNNNCVVVCPPNIFLHQLKTNNSNLFSGAQDVSIYNEGAYTGEISAAMLNDNNIKFCIVGHSERRQHFNESNKAVNLKSINLIKNKIIPVVCIGETLEEKEKKITKDVLLKQINESIPAISNNQNTIIAYEPIWAIGTGLTPTLDDINEVHSYIRNIDKKFNKFKILYGGSVKSSNSADINQIKNVDGCLIGGASLKVNEFNTIIS